ncbi:MAG: HAMP domain-containing histidine kinase [Bacteroidetes bacterium]|jgi:signal transduction histidine kinase|nr:HAMP domain-containing histidine kinase [Bacteroidota bacterium]
MPRKAFTSFEDQLDHSLIATMSSAGAVLCALFGAFGFIVGFKGYALLCLIAAAVLAILFLLNRYGKSPLIFWTFFLVIPFIIVCFIYFFGNLNSELYLISSAILVTFLSKRGKYWNEIVWTVLGVAFLASQYFLVSHGKYAAFTKLEQLTFFPNTIGALYLIYLVSRYFRNRQEARKNELLNDNMLKEKLISVLSHDLRGPFHSLSNLLAMHRQGDLDNETLGIYLQKLGTEVDRSAQMLDNLLYWIKGQMQGIQANPEWTNLGALVQENLALMKQNLEAKGIQTLVDDTLKHTLVMTDREMMNLIIRNLLSNAVKFCPETNGHIAIHIQPLPDQGRFALTIADNGAGMDQHKLDNLFKDGWKSEAGTKNEKGFGLGLGLVKQFSQVLHLDVNITSTLGQGTVCRLTGYLNAN